ncbi:Flp family type IVb pilin [Roseibium sp. SCPC15]|jgi:pilus assembly protein Flp/PilA|uniref:Flp family type IVb pilin n=1 Tax=Roseibium sp. SCP15 TaxID=3141376 RepID=UPI003336842F
MQITSKTVTDRFFRVRETALRLLRDESGATTIEYGLIAGAISVAILLSMSAIGTTIRDDYFNTVTTAMKNAMAAAGG